MKEANGTTLLDNVMLVYGSGIGDGNRHNHDDLPILLAGKGGGTIESGRHVVFPKRADTPLMNLYLALFERMGAPAKTLRRQHRRAEDLNNLHIRAFCHASASAEAFLFVSDDPRTPFFAEDHSNFLDPGASWGKK